MNMIDDLCNYASELFSNEFTSDGYFMKSKTDYNMMKKSVMKALTNYYGENDAYHIYDQWITSFYNYHQNERISDFILGAKFVIGINEDLKKYGNKET